MADQSPSSSDAGTKYAAPRSTDAVGDSHAVRPDARSAAVPMIMPDPVDPPLFWAAVGCALSDLYLDC